MKYPKPTTLSFFELNGSTLTLDDAVKWAGENAVVDEYLVKFSDFGEDTSPAYGAVTYELLERVQRCLARKGLHLDVDHLGFVVKGNGHT